MVPDPGVPGADQVDAQSRRNPAFQKFWSAFFTLTGLQPLPLHFLTHLNLSQTPAYAIPNQTATYIDVVYAGRKNVDRPQTVILQSFDSPI